MSQVNRNFAYLTDVDGHTVWEKLRVIRNFKMDREKALKLAELNQAKFKATKHELTEWELKEAEILSVDAEDIIQDCRDEIQFLAKLELVLADAAELERIDGATDREMYELNYPNEQRQRTLHQAKAERVAHGNISLDTTSRMMKDPVLANMLVESNLLDQHILDNINKLPKASGQLLLEETSHHLLGAGSLKLE